LNEGVGAGCGSGGGQVDELRLANRRDEQREIDDDVMAT
jgi:hypothetical protein